jgi:hypothetical protein
MLKDLVEIQQSQNLKFFIISYSTSACSELTLFINPQSRKTLVQKGRRGKVGKRMDRKRS